ncbi:uncharacterized protein LOC124943388 [Impatiens glandulifera]|uniref:uncharacterized protein LOC124943388 n=1 Tax=Impatiens glandulifera TaxID=253017 RepID=UPI001FB144B0|nr:uncharacterized protein LOC124943388 [Impatiens glandulifera]
MKCKKHLNDSTSEIGVCASCLRERLFSLISIQATEERKESESQHHPYAACNRNSNLNHNEQQHHLHHSISEQRFFSTPQVWSTSSTNDVDVMKKKKKKSRFSVISNLFRSKSDKIRMESTINNVVVDSSSSSTASPSWFTTMLSTNKKKKSRLFSFHKTTSRTTRDRGSTSDNVYEEDEDSFERSSGYSSESSYGYNKRTPMKIAGRPSHSRNSTMSPLVRLNQKGMPMNSGDVRLPPARTPLSNGSSFCSNRSRKLSDVGRFNHNR